MDPGVGRFLKSPPQRSGHKWIPLVPLGEGKRASCDGSKGRLIPYFQPDQAAIGEDKSIKRLFRGSGGYIYDISDKVG